MSIRVQNLGSISEGGRSWSQAALREEISGRRQELEAAGVAAGSTVALVQGNEAGFFANLFALWELGACAVPLSPLATKAELAWALGHCSASHVVENGRLSARARGAGEEAPPAGTALLLYTSGSTGSPKGVLLSFAAVEAKVAALQRVLSPEDLRRTLCIVPVSFGHGLLGNSLPALFSGQHLHLEPALSSELALGLGACLDRHEITFLSSVPAFWHPVLGFAPPPAKGSVRKAFCASAPLGAAEAAAARAWLGGQATFHNIYGITEAAAWIAELGGAPFGCELALDPASEEVLVRAPYLMSGYHREPEATREVLSGGWLRTGDLGRLHGGALTLTGRLKDQINRGGLKISPLEVENRLRLHPAVQDACVLGAADPVAGETVHAVLVPKPGSSPGAAELKEFCREALSEHKLPERFHFVDSLPRTSRGKLDKAALRRKLEGKE